MEILSPAGSVAALKAAVFNGADAVYLGLSEFNARMGAENFTKDNIAESVAFCHRRGVRVHAVLNTLVSNREMPLALETAKTLAAAGVDAFIVQDLGLADELMKRTDVELHASTQLCVHSSDGVSFLADMGFRRVVLARELSEAEIESITVRSPIETEVFCHGAMCMAYSGQCYMSAIVGQRSGNRGRCAQPCRLPYAGGYELSLKDMSLLRHVGRLEEIGVSSLKIEGRMKGAEYVGAVTRAYADAARGKPFDEKDEEFLAGIFSRNGFTDGYFTAKTGDGMFGVKGATANAYPLRDAEYKRMTVSFTLSKCDEKRLRLSARTEDGYGAESFCPCENATNIPTKTDDVIRSLSKLGDTVYELGEVVSDLPEDVFIPISGLNAARRAVLESISEMRTTVRHGFRDTPPMIPRGKRPVGKHINEAFFLDCVTGAEDCGADFLWLPVTQAGGRAFERVLTKMPNGVGVWLPQVYSDAEKPRIKEFLKKAKEQGITKVLVNNVGQIYACRDLGFEVAADFGLNVFNSFTADVLRRAGVVETTLSFELNFSQIKEVVSEESALTVYGKLPLMCVRNCIKKRHIPCAGNGHGKPYVMTDRTSRKFFVTCEYGCRNRIWNGDVLWLADREIPKCGYRRFIFADESEYPIFGTPEETIGRYERGESAPPERGFTRGLYFRKV